MSEAVGSELRSAAEAILIVADEPVTTSAIAEALGMEESVCEELLEGLDLALGQAWDDELESFRHAGAGAPVRWLNNRVG